MRSRSSPADPYFSIVIPAYNRAFVLDRTIRSCLAQTFPNFEIVIVDDGSKDDTPAVVARFDDARVVYERQENSGASAARNRGATLARGHYVAFLDSDDAFLPGKLQAFHEAIERAGEDAREIVWYSPLYFYRGTRNRLRKPDREIRPGESVGDYLFASDGIMQTSTLVLSRELFLKVPFNTALRNLEDLDLCMRLEAAGARFQMIPEAQVIWYDDNTEGRLSYTTTSQNIRFWLTLQRGRLSDKAYHGFLARYFVPVAIKQEPVTALRLLVAAVAYNSISLRRASLLVAKGMTPRLYGRLRDLLVSKRASGAAPPL